MIKSIARNKFHSIEKYNDGYVFLIKNEKIILCEKGINLFIKNKPLIHNSNGKKYLRISHNGKIVSFHRLLLNVNKQQHVDHINGNGLDNRLSNMRVCSQQQNSYNKKKSTKNYNHYKGVFKKIYKNKIYYSVKIGFKNKQIHVGSYSDPKEAAIAYDDAAIKYFGEFALTNKTLGFLGENNASV